MTEAVFKATYSDWRLVKTRKVVQIVFEVPVENSDMAYQVVGGMADSSQEKWFAIARLDESPPKPEPKPPRTFNDMTPAQQAGMLCADEAFKKFMEETGGVKPENVADTIRALCEVKSRSDILPGTEAARRWTNIVGEYRAWQNDPDYQARLD